MTQEPIHIISLGAGVQSSTMALMAARGEITPFPVAAIFADTQAEPASVYKWLDYLEPLLPYPVHRVSRGSLTTAITTLRERKDKTGHWVYSGIPTFNVNPDKSDGHLPRQCTYSFKIEILDKKAKSMITPERYKEWKKLHSAALREIGQWRKQVRLAKKAQQKAPPRPNAAWEECQGDPLIVQWIGISLDEIVRMKPSPLPFTLNRWPLVEMRRNRGDCVAWLTRNGFPIAPRSACKYCPYHSDQEWRRLRDEEPAEFAEAVFVDKEFRRLKAIAGLKGVPYLHASRKPLDEVDFTTDEDHGQQVMFGNDCTGMCGV